MRRSLLPAAALASACGGGAALRTSPSTPPAQGEVGTEPLYILGYGSLMFRFSTIATTCALRGVTAEELEAMESWAVGESRAQHIRDCIEEAKRKPMFPVKVRGVRRGWYAPGVQQYEKLGATRLSPALMASQALDVVPTDLGARTDPTAVCYAVVYPVSKEELLLTDLREAGFHYTPSFLSSGDLDVLGGAAPIPKDAKVRWYPMDGKWTAAPTAASPIVQSYVDLVVGGALELEKENNLSGFAVDVVASTDAWSEHWVNDRVYPHRPSMKNRLADDITLTLEKAALIQDSKLKVSHLQSISFPDAHSARSARVWERILLALVLFALVLFCASSVWKARCQESSES